MFRQVILFIVLCAGITAGALTIPAAPKNYVNDYAHMLSPQTVQQLNTTLRQFEAKTSNQIVVVTFPSLDGQSIEDASMQIAEKWKIGTKANDNGVLFTIFKNDHKARIEVGYGLEGDLTDTLSGIIIREQLTPAFRKGNYDKGIIDSVHAIMQATQGAYKASATTKVGQSSKHFYSFLGFFFLIVLINFIIWLSARATRHEITVNGVKKRKASFWRNFFWGFVFAANSASGGSRNSGGGGFSGGGGSFGGGGASGSW